MDEITIEGEVYISSKQAAKITGYAKDYVGQLCREGRVVARHIGRNWYVLESSIREHRFGKPEENASVDEEIAGPVDRTAAWQKPQYTAESPVFVPEFAEKPVQPPAPAIADMQSAWREWFEQKGESETVPTEQEPEPIEAEEEPQYHESEVTEYESVTISRISEPAAAPQPEYEPEEPEIEEEVPVEIHRTHAAVHQAEEVYRASEVPVVDLSPRAHAQRAEKPVSGTGTATLRALLIVVAVAAALVALIGTGYADTLLSGTSMEFGVQKTIIDFLGGKSTYQGSL